MPLTGRNGPVQRVGRACAVNAGGLIHISPGALAERYDAGQNALGDEYRADDLAVAADVYLGRRGEFDRSASPVARLQEFLGDTLADQALAGFVAVLSMLTRRRVLRNLCRA